MATLAEKLTSVQSAIAAIEGGAQSVTQNGRTLTYADLKSLYDREERLERQIDRASNGSRTVAEF